MSSASRPNRSRELEAKIAELELRLTTRLDALEREQERTASLARHALALPIELARRQAAALLETIRAYSNAAASERDLGGAARGARAAAPAGRKGGR